LLFAIGWFLAQELYANEELEDCLLSGRTNCAPIDSQSRWCGWVLEHRPGCGDRASPQEFHALVAV